MPALLFALALLTADDPAAGGADAPAPPPMSQSAAEDYGFVAWCYGALRGYLELHDEVMPEVTRIESTYRRPGSNLAEDLKVYEELQRKGSDSLDAFARAMKAAEASSPQPIGHVGVAAVQKGRATWTRPAGVTKARVAQEWMSWTLPAACDPTAASLEKSALSAVAPPSDAPSRATDAAAPAPTP